MNALAIVKSLKAEQIRARLNEIARLEREHAARNLDAELAEVWRRGGDVDAEDEQQVQAERIARRLRVERLGLETELPLAIQREGKEALSGIVEEHTAKQEEAVEAVGALVAAFEAFRLSSRHLLRIQAEAAALTEKAGQVSNASGAPMPDLGNFKSGRVTAVAEEMFGFATNDSDMWLANLRHFGTRGVVVGNNLYKRAID